MNRKIIVAAAQLESKMGDKRYNLEKAINYIELASKQKVDIICFPEMYYTGFDLCKEDLCELAESVDGELYQRLSEVAISKNINIIIPYPETNGIQGVVYNSSMLVGSEGQLLGNHRKQYLCQEEKGIFRRGSGYAVNKTKVGNIGMLICYEMEFPEPARILTLCGAEILFVPTVFMGVDLMDRYLSAIAIQNLIYVVAVNTIGNKRKGKSKILNQLGDVIKEATEDVEELLICEIDLDENVRRVYPHFNDFEPKTLNWCLESAKVFTNKYE